MFIVCKSLYLLKLFFWYFTKNIIVKPSIRPDIRYPVFTVYPLSGFWISWISGRPDIRQKQYPVHPRCTVPGGRYGTATPVNLSQGNVNPGEMTGPGEASHLKNSTQCH
jgi:hypothetical protein